MSRSCSTEFKAAAFAQETAEVPTAFVAISHADLAIPIRINTSGEDLTRGGEIFYAFPFEITLPGDAANMPAARLRIDNTDRQVVQAVRSINTAPAVDMALALASQPDTTEASFSGYKLTNVTYDVGTVEGDVTVEDFTSEPYPCGIQTPGLYPGMF